MENTVEFRRAIKKESPKFFLEAEHTQNCRVLRDRLVLLDLLPKNGIVAEVGVAFGDFTAEIIARNAPRLLHLVDTWGTERYKDGLELILQRYDNLVKADALVVNKGLSTQVLPEFSDDYFDWLYIDTDHSYKTTIAELRLAARKVKAKGGIIAGHDHCPGNVITPWPYGVIEACNQFCVEDGWQYLFLTVEPYGHQSFALSKL